MRAAAGFVMGEGAGILVLEEYEHARARGAKIYAEVVRLRRYLRRAPHHRPRPDGSGGARAMQQALEQAGMPPARTASTSTPTAPAPRSTTPPKPPPSKQALGEERREAAGHQLHQVHDRPYAGRGGRGGGRSPLRWRSQNGVIPPTIGYGAARPRLRPELHAPCGAGRRRRTWRFRCRWASAATTARWRCSRAED